MFIDRILDTLLRPFRELYGQWMRVRAIKGGIQGDVRRVQALGGQVQNYGKQAANFPGQVGQQVQGYQQHLSPAQQAASPQQSNQAAFPPPSNQAAFPPPSNQAAPAPPSKKMSWFPWSKKTCPRCNNKLLKSWDQCPYCGLNQSQGMQPGQQGTPNQQGQFGQQGQPGQPGMMPGQPGQPGMMPGPQGYPGQPGQPGMMPGPQGYPAPMPGPGGAQRTMAMDVGAIAAPLMSTGDREDNVAWLVPLEGAQTGELLQFKGRVLIGTADGCDFRMLDASISGRHSEITVDNQGRFRVNDLGSTNGTYVNDKKVSSIELVDGDNIRLGRTTFRFKTKR